MAKRKKSKKQSAYHKHMSKYLVSCKGNQKSCMKKGASAWKRKKNPAIAETLGQAGLALAVSGLVIGYLMPLKKA